jgi:predicted RND superfamily exporter protein
MIAILAALFVLGGLLMFYTSGKEATEALQQLRELPDEMVFPEPIVGKTLTVAEVRQTVEREPYLVLGLNWLLALIMAGLYLWSRRSPFPAVIAALAVFVVVHVANAVVDPVTIVKGIILKVIAIIALVKGVRAGFAVRALERGRPAD